MPNASVSTTVSKWLGLALISTKGTKWALADQIVVSGSNFLSSILLARILGINDFGQYTLAWTIVLFLQSLQYSSIGMMVLSIGPKHGADQAPTFFGAMFVHQVIFALISSVLVVVGGYTAAMIFPEWQLDVFALPIAAAVISSQTQDFLRRYFFSVGRAEVSFTIDTIRYVGQIVLIIAMIKWLPANSIVGLWLVAGAAAIASFAAMPFVPALKYSLSETIAAGLRGWHFSKWLLASTLLTAAANNLFSFAAAILLGPAMVGAMKASQNVVGVAHLVVEAAANIIPPCASRELVSGGRGALFAYLKRVTVRGTVVMVCIVGDICCWLEVLAEFVFWTSIRVLFELSGMVRRD